MIPLVVVVSRVAAPNAALADEPPTAPEAVSDPVPGPELLAEPEPGPDLRRTPAVTTIILSNPVPPVIAIAPVPPVPVPSPQQRSLTGPLAGALTALIPLTVGGLLWAQDDRPDLQRSGAGVMLAGFAAAPWVAEGLSGRWRRAFGFGLVSLAASTTAVITMDRGDVFNPAILNGGRLPFATALTVAFFAAAAGVIDSLVMASPAAATSAEVGDWR